jgi:hypothetical protein
MDAVIERQSEFLSASEVRELTDYAHAKQQAEWLTVRGIPHKLESRRVVLSRVHVRGWLEGRHMVAGSGINFGAIK